MAKRYFNWKLAIVLVIGLVVLGITAYGLRQWQRSRGAGRGLEAGNKAYNERKWEEAARDLGRYLTVASNDVPTLLKYADAQLNIRPTKRSNVRQAIAAYRNILITDENNSEAAMRLAELYLGMGMPGEAELIAGRALETSQSPKLRRMLAVALANQRKFKEAAEELKAIIKEYPEQILAYGVLGQLIEQRPADFSQAPQFWFDEAVKNNPSAAEAYIIRGAYYLRHRDRVKALADLEQAEKQDLSDPSIRLRLAMEFINTNALDKAEEHLVAVQMAEPANQALWQAWARLALRSQSKAKMLKVAETGLKELSSQPWDFMLVAAELFIRCGRLDSANDCISKLRQKDIAPATVAFLEGLVADQKQQGYEAVECWRRAMQLGNKSPQIRLAIVSALSRLGDMQSALQQLRTLVSERPDFLNGRLAFARMLAQTGDWAGAAEQARMASQISPDSLNAALLYIRTRIQLLQQSQADKDFPIWQDINEQLARLENATNGALEVRLLQFQLAMRLGNFTDAEALVTELKKAYPSQIKVAMAGVELLTTQDKTDEAILKLYDVSDAFPQSIIPLRYLASLLAAKDRRSECEKIIKDALTRMERTAAKRELGLLLAGFYNRWNEQEKRFQLLNSLVYDFPDDIILSRELLRCKKVIKNSDQAQQLVNRIKAIEGEEGWQWRYEQAKIWFAQENFKNRYPQIISLLKENLLANPDDQASRTLLAAAYGRAGQLRLAISTYSEALNRSPQDLRIIVPTVAALYKANEYGRADEILRRAANEKIFGPELRKLELKSHLRRGELNSASDILEELLIDDPNNQSIGLSLALLKMQQNRFTEADELLSKLKIAEPNSLSITVAQIELNIRQDKSAEALLLCDEVVNKFNNALAYILRARTYASLSQPGRAKKDFEYATVIEPNNAEAWIAKSDFYRSIGQFDKAIADIQKAISVAPDNLVVQKRAVLVFLASGNRDTIDEGKNILDNALAANPEDVELRLYKARSLLTEGTAPVIEEATYILQAITNDQPKLSDAWALLAEIALRQGQSAKAIDIALRGLVHRPNDKSLLLLKARSEAVRSPALAIPTLKALREIDPNDTNVVVRLANTYLASGKFEKAVNLLKTQLVSRSSAPDERKIRIGLAVALYKSGNKDEAEKEFDLLFQSAPDDPTPLLAQARLLKDDQLWGQLNQKVIDWRQNHSEDIRTPTAIARELATSENSQAKKTAENILRIILENNSDFTEALSLLAMLLQTTGRSAEAVPLYQQILELEPDNVITINNLAWIMCEEQGKYQQALELAQRGLRKAPDYIDLIDTRGVVYYKLGQYDKAIADFTRCTEMYPYGTPLAAASYLHLGKAEAAIGQRDKAIESLKKALELNTKIEGLSTADFTEAQRLLDELSKGGV